MTAPVSDYTSLTCPLPECVASLHITWTLGRPVFVGDLTANFYTLPAVDDAYTSTWQVECEEGHVVLVPGPAGCPCDAETVVCPHGGEFDSNDELRTFRIHDLDRLRALVDALLLKAGAR